MPLLVHPGRNLGQNGMVVHPILLALGLAKAEIAGTNYLTDARWPVGLYLQFSLSPLIGKAQLRKIGAKEKRSHATLFEV